MNLHQHTFHVPDASRMGPECTGCPAFSRCLLGRLSAEESVSLASHGRRRIAASGENLLWEGDASPVVAIVCSGRVALTVNDADGSERIVGLAHSGEFIGRPFGTPTPYGVSAVGEVRLCTFTREVFDKLAQERSGLGHELLLGTLDELERSRRWLGMLGRKTAEQKVAAFVLECARAGSGSEDDARIVDLPFTRQQIADVLGITMETVSREFTGLRMLGAIELQTSRRIRICDRAELRSAAGEACFLH